MSRISDLGEARVEMDEARSWVCASCDKMIEENEEGSYCRSCASYWKDVQNGLFDRDDDMRIVPCETCGTEGRIFYRGYVYEPGCTHAHIGDARDEECPDCEGACGVLIAVEPITLEDLGTGAP